MHRNAEGGTKTIPQAQLQEVLHQKDELAPLVRLVQLIAVQNLNRQVLLQSPAKSGVGCFPGGSVQKQAAIRSKIFNMA